MSIIDEPEVREVLASYPVLLPPAEEPIPSDADALGERVSMELAAIAASASSARVREERFAGFFASLADWFGSKAAQRAPLDRAGWRSPAVFEFPDPVRPRRALRTRVAAGGALVEKITKASGYHPFLWYLMCRRPELEKAGVRPRQVARVAGCEWDQLAAPELTLFLVATVRFLNKHPLPATKNDLKTFKQTLVAELPTPNRGIVTNAMRQVLQNTD